MLAAGALGGRARQILAENGLPGGCVREEEPIIPVTRGKPRRIRAAETEIDLAGIEDEVDELLTAQLIGAHNGDPGALDVTAVNSTAHRLESLIHYRRLVLASRHAPPAQES